MNIYIFCWWSRTNRIISKKKIEVTFYFYICLNNYTIISRKFHQCEYCRLSNVDTKYIYQRLHTHTYIHAHMHIHYVATTTRSSHIHSHSHAHRNLNKQLKNIYEKNINKTNLVQWIFPFCAINWVLCDGNQCVFVYVCACKLTYESRWE